MRPLVGNLVFLFSIVVKRIAQDFQLPFVMAGDSKVVSHKSMWISKDVVLPITVIMIFKSPNE